MKLPADELTTLPTCRESLTIIEQQRDYLLIEKPAGLLSVPGRNPANGDCVSSRLSIEYPSVGIVHRLDFDTSGIMVVALNKKAHGYIARQFQERETYKQYVAIVSGRLSAEEGDIDLPLTPDKDNRPKSKVCHDSGKPALTHYRVLEYDARRNRSRVLLEPATGRSHQLRLHMAAIGHPILGCGFYAPQAIAGSAVRLLLHASELHFVAPDGRTVRGISSCPF